MNVLDQECMALDDGIEVDYKVIQTTISKIVKSIEKNIIAIMDATIDAADNDRSTISMSVVLVPDSDILSFINDGNKSATPIYFFRGEHGTELSLRPMLDLTLEIGFLLKQYEMRDYESYAPGVVLEIGDESRGYFLILSVIDYDEGDDEDEQFSARAENMLLILRESVASVLDKNLTITYWGTFNGIPLVERIRR